MRLTAELNAASGPVRAAALGAVVLLAVALNVRHAQPPPPGVARTCSVPPMSLTQLAGFAHEWAPAQPTAARVLDTRVAEQLPPEIAVAIERLVEHIRERSGCADGATLTLTCAEHEAWLGPGLAAISESIRRATILASPSLCQSTFLSWPGFSRIRNTAGAMLEMHETWQLLARSQAAELGERPRVTLYSGMRIRPRLLNSSFLELLFGMSWSQPCEAEVERVCGVSLSERTLLLHELVAQLRTGAAGAARARARLASVPPPRVLSFRMTMPGNVSRPMPKGVEPQAFLEKEFEPRTVDRLGRDYERARKLFPMAVPYAVRGDATHRAARNGTAGMGAPGGSALNVLMYVRSGAGSMHKTVADWAFLPALNLIADACPGPAAGPASGARALHLHVFSDYNSSTACCDAVIAWAASRPAVRIFVHIDSYRLHQWHAMWSADVIIATTSKTPHHMGVISPNVRVLIDGWLSPPRSPPRSARRFGWLPCKVERGTALCMGSSGPTVGLEPGAAVELTSILRHLCARGSDWLPAPTRSLSRLS